jgi:hypothetical protein
MKFIFILLPLVIILPACNMKELIPVYESSKVADNYPSGSTISYLDNRFYIMGDDAAEILLLNDRMDETERIPLFPKGDTNRLPKASKADIEASAIINYEGTDSILFLGSGSLSPHRDSAFLLNPKTKAVRRLDMRGFYDQLRTQLEDLNIEAAASMENNLLIGVRANKRYPDNYLVLAERAGNSYKFQRKIKIALAIDEAGISGLDHDAKRDVLFITFSTEDTANSYDDGNIGESYLAVLTNAKQLLMGSSLVIPSLTKLTDLHSEFKSQKIESVSLKGDERKLLLVADDDRGNTKLFTLGF